MSVAWDDDQVVMLGSFSTATLLRCESDVSMVRCWWCDEVFSNGN